MRYRTVITTAGLAALLSFTSSAALADIGVERTPAGEAGMDQLDRGLDSRSQQSQLLNDQLERQRRQLETNRDRSYGTSTRTDRPRTERRDFRREP